MPEDLLELGDLYARAGAVAPMVDVAHGLFTRPTDIGLRHDVDNVITPAVQMAEWEKERGYRSTYFILHTAPYWEDKPLLESSLERIAEAGHEIGFHVNAITAAIHTGNDPLEIVEEALAELRGYGHTVTGVVAHGDAMCYRHGFVNDEIFTESARPDYGAPDRVLHDSNLKLQPVSRERFGLTYDPNWLPRSKYLSDSGGRWSAKFSDIAAGFPYEGQLHLLVHPDWWSHAFAPDKVAA